MSEGKKKILNLYAGIGGNRKLWGDDYEITAVEYNEHIAKVYTNQFPNDKMIIGDAHQYLLEHFSEYDFIWSSPPCPSHSRARYWGSSNYYTKTEAIYPDMKLYQEILFLQHYYKTGKWVVENVIPYYEPLIKAHKRGRHLYWTNFKLPSDLGDRKIQVGAGTYELKRLCEFHNIDISAYKGEQSMIKVARNLVDYESGKKIFETAIGIIKKSKDNQLEIFN